MKCRTSKTFALTVGDASELLNALGTNGQYRAYWDISTPFGQTVICSIAFLPSILADSGLNNNMNGFKYFATIDNLDAGLNPANEIELLTEGQNQTTFVSGGLSRVTLNFVAANVNKTAATLIDNSSTLYLKMVFEYEPFENS